MRIVVHMRPGAREAKLEKLENGEYKAWVTAIPEKGKANAALMALLAKEFGVSKSAVSIVIGKTAREKLVEINGI